MDYGPVRILNFSNNIFRTKDRTEKKSPWYGLIGPKSEAYAGQGSNPDQNLNHGPDRRISDQKSAPHTKIRTGFLYMNILFGSNPHQNPLFPFYEFCFYLNSLFPISEFCFQSHLTVSNILYLFPISLSCFQSILMLND